MHSSITPPSLAIPPFLLPSFFASHHYHYCHPRSVAIIIFYSLLHRLKNVSRADIPRGLVACNAVEKYPRIASFIALIAVTDHPSSIHVGYTFFICVHTRTVSCKIINIIDRVDKSKGISHHLCFFLRLSFSFSTLFFFLLFFSPSFSHSFLPSFALLFFL